MEMLGQRILSENLITKEQLEQALERQRLHGGRIGQNLVALGFVSNDELEDCFTHHPEAPLTMEAAGMTPRFASELALKQALFLGDFTLSDLGDRLRLPTGLVDQAIRRLQEEKMLEVKGADHYMRATFTFSISEQGREKARKLLELNRYVGPAPVPLEDYQRIIVVQTIKNIIVREESVANAFSELVISDKLLRQLGPAVSSGAALFLYGPPGNGKTTIAEQIGKILPGAVYVPYALMVEGEIIRVYDPVTHSKLDDPEDPQVDARWALVRRPVIVTGGELTLNMLDLELNQTSKFYEAPLQMKANNGLFIVDDFGRQRMEPQALLNRWIVPLERRTDFLSLDTGVDFEIPFDQLVIFSTNLEPKTLVDDAFLRRIRYKIKIGHPDEIEYEQIFRRICDANEIEFDRDAFDFLLDHFYRRLGAKFNACHPRDLVNYLIDHAHYFGRSEKMSREGIAEAWESYFVEM
jgi:MoxR-like ATPase